MNIKSYPKPVLFFDNDVKNFEEIEIYNDLPIECIHVEEIPINALELHDNVYTFNKSNAYVEWLEENIEIERALQRDISPSEALNDDHIDYIKQWIYKTNGMYKERYVLFDWDRTLSMWEGFYTFNNDIKPFRKIIANGKNVYILDPLFAKDMLTYLLDNKNNRLQKIKNLISELLDRNIEVIIVTNNSSLLNISNPYYLKNLNIWVPLLQELDNRLTSKNLIYGGLLGKYKAIKKRFPNIKNISVLETYKGGKRKKSNRNKRTKRKQLRKTKKKK